MRNRNFGPRSKAVVAGVSAAIAGLLMGHVQRNEIEEATEELMRHKQGDKILAELEADVRFERIHKKPAAAGLMLEESGRVRRHRVSEVVGGAHLDDPEGMGVSYHPPMAGVSAAAEIVEFAATPHHGLLRMEAKDKFIAAMTRRGIKVPLSMLLS